MANDLIPLSLAPHSNDLRSALSQLREARTSIEQIRQWMLHSIDTSSSNSDYSPLELRFGSSAGTGASLFTLVDGTLQVLDGTVSGYAKDLLSRVG